MEIMIERRWMKAGTFHNGQHISMRCIELGCRFRIQVTAHGSKGLVIGYRISFIEIIHRISVLINFKQCSAHGC